MFQILLLITAFDATAWASPHERADPFNEARSHVRTIMPKLQFAVDGALRKNVEFWIRIYTEYYTYQGVIHDAKNVDRVYEILDFRADPSRQEKFVREAKSKWKDVLLSIHRKRDPEKLNDEERRIYQMFLDTQEPNKFLNAAHRKRLRFQLGQRDRFVEGLKQSGRYLKDMEEIFRREGLPVELTRLPFVESSFNVGARSRVGASGIWQFMRSTGKLFLRIDDAVDERNDPIRATEAAARLLRINYESLKSWPLAVTAYNHGRMGMMRAVRQIGSYDLEEVVTDYRSRSFGFASSNFFSELLAAIEVERDAERHFGKFERQTPLVYFETPIPDYIDVRELTRFLNLDLGQVSELNPGLSDAVFTGDRLVPAGYRLRLPLEADGDSERAHRVFQAGYSQIPKIYKLRAQRRVNYDRRVTSEQRKQLKR